MKSAFRGFIDLNHRASAAFDRLLPAQFTVDGNRNFQEQFAPEYLKDGMLVYDVGSGRTPFVDHDLKKAKALTVIGVDIDERELASAPPGIYDKTLCVDILNFKGRGDADIVICQALLEHVKDVDKAFAAISGIVKPSGFAVLFLPSKNAVFARLNMILPQSMKKSVLYYIYPETKDTQGFTAYYDKCTPNEFRSLAERHGFSVDELRVYFKSSYFSFFFPAYLLWRIWIVTFRLLYREQAAETFCMALRKTA